MHTLEEIKNELIDHIYRVDKSKLSIMDLRTYVDIVKIADEIDRANKPNEWMELMGTLAASGFSAGHTAVALKED